MLMKVYSVFDTKAKAYLPPFFATNAAVAGRMMEDACSDPKHPFNVHSADYILFEVADFDDDSGIFTSQTHVNLGNLVTFKPVRDVDNYERIQHV